MSYFTIQQYKTGEQREVRCYESEIYSVMRDWPGWFLVTNYEAAHA